MEWMFGRMERTDGIHQFKSWLHFVVTTNFLQTSRSNFNSTKREGGEPVLLSQRVEMIIGKMDLASVVDCPAISIKLGS